MTAVVLIMSRSHVVPCDHPVLLTACDYWPWLAVATEIARGHGGTLEVQSTVGQGTTCLIRLPRVQPGAAPV